MDFSKYLTEQEMREIAEQEFKDFIRNKSQNDLERIITNSAYTVVWKAVDEALDEEAIDLLKEKVLEVIDELSSFSVFAKPNAWDRQENTAYHELMKAVKNNSDLIESVVKNQLKTMSKTQIAKISSEVMKEKLGKVI